MSTTFAPAFVASGPHPSLGAHAETYGRVIGDWRGERRLHAQGGSIASAPVEAHFAWVLEGRAVQDVWISPAPSGFHGTSLRVFEPARDAWRVLWWNPQTGVRLELEGRRRGDDVVQLGVRERGPIRWTFSEIEPRAFRWHAHVLEADGERWRLETEMRFVRA